MTVEMKPVLMQVGGVGLHADVAFPPTPKGVVAFAHGSGSSRHSPRNQAVARTLNSAGLATVLADLLTDAEEQADVITRKHRFDIELLSERMVGVVDWLRGQDRTSAMPVGLFGASTGAAAALAAAARRSDEVVAVVSRGGRPDLAGSELNDVQCDTLLIVGERDADVLDLNRSASEQLPKAEVRVIEGATHLFEEPGALDEVASLTAAWFSDRFAAGEEK